jgi:hypothetical protein
VDTDVEELIDAGVVVCIAAGNRSHKVDISGGSDYDNYIVTNNSSSGSIYYHRGSSPYSTKAFIIFDPHQAKLADPGRGNILLNSLQSFLLEKGGKI